MTEFIFMLTHNDATLSDALEVYGTLRGIEGLRYVGFKDVGVPFEQLKALADAIRADGRTSMLEVVSEDPAAELRSIEAAVRLGVDWVLGGTHPETALPVLAGTGLRYCPFPGTVIGHPSLLRGTVESIAESARGLTAHDGVHGLDLLAYRFDGDVPALVRAVVAASAGPVIAAGSVDSEERIRTLAEAGVWGYTIGGAIVEGRMPGGPSIADQVREVLALTAAADASVGAAVQGVALPR
jgi:hypothetical protein